MGRRVSVAELVGRGDELAVLDAALSDTSAGAGRLVLVEGDAGVGKSRLVQAFTSRATAGGATVLAGGCLQLEADIPYAPFTEALRAIPNPPLVGSGGAGNRSDEFRRVAETIADAGNGAPVVLVIEDLHWADASTRDLLVFLHRALHDAPVLQIGTRRVDETTADHPVAALVAELARSPRTERLPLRPLDRAEVLTLARAILGVTPARSLVDTLVARAEGNPFFTEELLAGWPVTGDVPRTVREVVITRLARLAKDAQQVARLAAVVGSTVSHDLLAELAGMPAPALEGAVRELIAHGQLVPGDGDAYTFRHALIREALYADLLPSERRRTHAAVARLLAGNPAQASTRSRAGAAAELAHHWDAAGAAAEALVASLAAGGAAEATLAPAEAHAHYERAVTRWVEVADPVSLTGIDHDTLLERAAEAASLASRNARAVELTKQRLSALDERAEPERVALASEALSYRAWASADWHLARAAIDRAVALVSDDSPARIRIVARRAGLGMLASRHRQAVRHAEELLPLAEAAGDTAAVARGLMVLGVGLVGLGRVEEGLGHLRRHLELANASLEPRPLGVAYANQPETLIWADRPADALALALEGLERCERYGFEFYRWLVVGNVVRALAELGRWDEALDSAADPTDPFADPFTRLPVDLARANVLVDRGDHEATAELLDRSGKVLDGQDDVQHGTELAAIRAKLAAAEHRWADARAAVREGLRVALPADNQHRTARLVAIGVRVEADAVDDARVSGFPVDIGAAMAMADALLADGRSHQAALAADGVIALPRTTRSLGVAAAERTRLDASDPAAWAEVAATAGIDRHLAGYAWFREAEAVLATRGSRQRATSALTEAVAVAAALGAHPLADLVRSLAERARLTITAAPEPAAKASDLGLTAREAEVLELIGRGLTNGEIAVELFISAKTASVHVSNILRKLGLRSRIQAAALAQRRAAKES